MTAPNSNKIFLWKIVSELIFLSLALFSALVVYGIYQEKVMTSVYDDVTFHDSSFLVLSNRTFAFVISLISFLIINKSPASCASDGKLMKSQAPLWSYAFVSLTNLLASICQYESLKYVSFATQTIMKSMRILPTLLLSWLVFRKACSFLDLGLALIISAGCATFILGGNITSSSFEAAGSTSVGLVLLAGFLGFDAVTSITQDKAFKGYDMSIFEQMMYVNAFSLIFSVVSYLFRLDELRESIGMMLFSVSLLRDVIILSFCATISQVLIYRTIKRFSAVTFSTIMTTRQMFSILLSSLIFQNALSCYQIAAVVLVSAALYLKAYVSFVSHRDIEYSQLPK